MNATQRRRRYAVHPFVKDDAGNYQCNFAKILVSTDNYEGAVRAAVKRQYHYTHGVICIDWQTGDAWAWRPGSPAKGQPVTILVNRYDVERWMGKWLQQHRNAKPPKE